MDAETPFDTLNTWGTKINDSDIEYIRADLLASRVKEARAEAFKDALTMIRAMLPTSAGAGDFKEAALRELEAAAQGDSE